MSRVSYWQNNACMAAIANHFNYNCDEYSSSVAVPRLFPPHAAHAAPRCPCCPTPPDRPARGKPPPRIKTQCSQIYFPGIYTDPSTSLSRCYVEGASTADEAGAVYFQYTH